MIFKTAAHLLQRAPHETFIVLPILRGRPILSRLYFAFTIHSRVHILNENIQMANIILDVGCGGGFDYLCTKGAIIGVDLSLKALRNAKTVYADCVNADIGHLPFRNFVFDQVVSIDVFGHIPRPIKPKALSEVYRVSRKGGAHIIECDSIGVLTSLAKRFPRLYNKYFIDLDGHLGLERANIVINRFRSYFEVTRCIKICSDPVMPLQEYLKRFANEYQKKSTLLKLLTTFSRSVLRSGNFYLIALIDCLLGILSKLWNLITPTDMAACVCIVCKRRG